jgi:hypothetical protein
MLDEKKQQMQLKNFLQKYSFDDLAKCFFVLNLWLPNVGCPIKIQYLYFNLESIYFNLPPENKIKSYSDFKIFCKSLFELLPSFEMLEDYVPEFDWGDVKYYFQEKFYKIFYGGDLSNPYDFYYAFEIIHTSIEKEYLDLIKRSPIIEMKFCLELQDYLLTNLSQTISKTIDTIKPGDIEVPNEEFWRQACEFIDRFRPEINYNVDLLTLYSKTYNDPTPDLSIEFFIDNAYKGQNCQYFFIKKDNRYYPALPRKWLGVIYDGWGILMRDNYKSIEKKLNKQKLNVLMSIELSKFLLKRLNENNVFPLVKSIKPDLKTAHDLVFTAIQNENRIYFVYVTPPFFNQNKIVKHIKSIQPKLIESAALIKQQPTRIGLIFEQKIVEFKSTKKDKLMKAFFLIVLPSPLSGMQGIIEVPSGIDVEIMPLDQFVGIIDEIQNPKELGDFINYLSEENILARISSQNSILDRYGFFKDSYGIPIPGAIEPDQIVLDTNWGSNFRYNSLKKFWDSFPEEGFFWHPRSWTIPSDMKTKTGLVFHSRVFFGYAYYQKINKTSFYINSPVHLMELEEGRINDSVLLSIFDLINIYSHIVEKLNFSRYCNKIHIFLCPSTLVLKKDELAHVKHLVSNHNPWRMDCLRLASGEYGIRVVYNFEKIIEELKVVEDRSVQIRLFIEILEQLGSLVPEPNLQYVKRELEGEKSKKARFKVYEINKMVSFPEGVKSILIDPKEYKLAKKEIAKIALEISILPGLYSAEEGIIKTNNLRSRLVQVLNGKIKLYNLDDAIPVLLENANALVHDYWRTEMEIDASRDYEVDYDRGERSSAKERKFIHLYGVHRYLIEKIVQLQPAGKTELNETKLKELLAFADRLIDLYVASDFIKYELYPVKIHIDRDYLVSISDEKNNITAMEKRYGEEQAKLNLGIIGNKNDSVDSSFPLSEYIGKLDVAFKRDVGFGFKNFIQLQQVLATWAINAQMEEKAYYHASKEDIASICLKKIIGFNVVETNDILNFLTLKAEGVLAIKGDPHPAEDIPIWEHNKRLMRFEIRPLIKIGDQYFWGPHSILRTSHVWSAIIKKHKLPSDIDAPTVKEVLRYGHKDLENTLVEKVKEITLRHTANVMRDLFLHKYNNEISDIGDCDVLAFIEDKNILLNIESKVIDSPHSNKDSGRIQRKIFGEFIEGGISKKGYLQRVEERESYLKAKGKDLLKELGWGTPSLNPKVVSIFVTKIGFWWTKHPPVETEVQFIEIRLLDDFIRNL